MRKLLGLALSILLLFVAPVAIQAGPGTDLPGAVYTMTNAVSGNEVLVYPRAAQGALGAPTAYSTGGLGTGGGLGNQSGLVLTQGDRWLLVVNAGNDTVSALAVTSDGLELMDVEPSRGTRPVSVTEDRGLVYVLNAGSDSIAGFRLDPHGGLAYLPGSERPLSGSGTGAAQVGFDPGGRVLVITEKATNLIDTYVIGRDGLATASTPQTFPSPGNTPFGFDFGKRGQLFVSEANGGSAGSASASSWQAYPDGTLTLISGSVGSGETAACWLLVTNDGRYAYTTNTPSASISRYEIATDGMLTVGAAQAALLATGAGPIDMAFSNDGRNLYTLNTGDGTIGIFRLRSGGTLIPVPSTATVPSSANGMAAR